MGDLLLRRNRLTTQKLRKLAHFYSLSEVKFLEGELWLSKMGSYMPRSIWNFYACIRFSSESWQVRLWQMVICLVPFLFHFLVDSLFLPAIPCWIFRLKEDTVLSGNQIHHKVTDAYVALLSRHRKICKCGRICLNHPVRL